MAGVSGGDEVSEAGAGRSVRVATGVGGRSGEPLDPEELGEVQQGGPGGPADHEG